MEDNAGSHVRREKGINGQREWETTRERKRKKERKERD
jgi:hypothetical protein